MSKHRKAQKSVVQFKRKPLITALEPRILLDGAAVATGAEALTDVAYDDAVDMQNQPDALAPVQVQAADPSLNNGRKEVAFVDSSVNDYETLVAGIKSGIEVFVLNGASDGITQIQRWAQQNGDYDAIHLISHGDDGQISLGTTVLSDENLATYSTALTDIGSALTADGDLLVYGCDVGGSQAGIDFIARIAQLTGADVAASDDTTGGQSPSDWVMEIEEGDVESAIALTDEAAGTFDGSLALVNKTVHTYSSNTWAFSQLASDSSGTQYLVHMLDYTSISVKTWDGSAWSIHSTITTTDTGNTSISNDLDIQIDSNDNIHIVYRPSDGSGVTSTRGIGYGFYDGSSWSFEWVQNASSSSGWRNFDDPILKVDANGKAHLLYEYSDSHIGVDYVRYATNASGSWAFTDLTTGTGGQDEVFVSSLDIDSSGDVHAFYIREDDQNTYQGNLYYRALSGGSWSAETKLVDATGESKNYSGYTAAIDSSGKVHLVYSYSTYDPTTYALTSSNVYYKTNISGSWVTSSLESSTTRDNYSAGLMFRGNDLYLLIDSWAADWSSNNYHFATLQSGDSDWWLGDSFSLSGGSELQFNISNADKFMTVTEDSGLRNIYSQAGDFDDYFTPQNTVPTLTSMSNITGGTEDTEKEISFSDLTAAADEADSDGSVTGFVVKAVSTGTLKIGTSAGTATAWASGSNDTIDATNKAFWTPAAHANGNLNAFTVVAEDDAGGESASAVQVVVETAAVNDAPTLSSNASLTAIDEDVVSSDFENVSGGATPANEGDYVDDLLVASGYADADGELPYGIAIAGDASDPSTEGKWQYSNDVYGDYWRDIGTVSTNAALLLNAVDTYLRFVPVADFSGTPGGLTVYAVDNSVAGSSRSYSTWDGTTEDRHTFDTTTDDATSDVSASGMTWNIVVNGINDAPTLTVINDITGGAEDTEKEISLSDLSAAADEADVDGSVTGFVVKAVSSGTLKIGASSATATAWAAGTNDTLDATHKAFWTPASDANGNLNAFTVVAEDDSGAESSSAVQVVVAVTAVNDVPTLTAISNITGGTEDTEQTISFSDLTSAADEADSDGSVTGFVVQAVSSGTLKIGATAGTATAWVAGSNDTIDATNKAFWTPAANANGNLNAFTVVAEDDAGGESASAIQVVVETAAVNDAPTLSSNASLTAIDEDVVSNDFENVSGGGTPANEGDYVDDLLVASGYADADGELPYGIAIVGDAADPTTEGKWQYSNDVYGDYWHDIGTVSTNAALLLNAVDTYLRFVPVADFSGTPGGLTVYAVDNSTAGSSRSYTSWDGTSEDRYTVDTTTDDATSDVSASGMTWNIAVTNINDKPVIANLGAADDQTVSSAQSAALIDQETAAAVSDVDLTDFDGGSLTLSFASGRLTGDLVSIRSGSGVSLSSQTDVGSTITIDGQVIGTIASNGTGSGGDSLIVSLNSQATAARLSTLVQNLTFDTDSDTAGDRVLNLVLTDGDGGTSDTAAVTFSVTVNPTVTITVDSTTLLAGETANVTFNFSEAPVGFTADDITVSGGVLSNLQVDGGDNSLYTATYTPDADTQSLSGQISIAADTFTSASSENNLASNNLDISGDTKVPTVVSIERQTPTEQQTHADSLTYRVTFSETVNTLSASDFSVTGTTATITNVVAAGGNGWDITLSGGDLAALDGTVTLAFAAGHAVQDVAGNALVNTTPSGSNESSYTVDNTAPTLTIDTVAGDDRINAAEDNSSVTVSGSTSAEDGQTVTVDVSGVSKSATVSGGSWSISLSSAEVQGLSEGTVSITADADDQAGNSASQAITSVNYDRTLPEVGTITRELLQNPATTDSFDIVLQYVETGVGIDASTVTASNLQVTGPGSVGTLTVSGVTYNAATRTATYTVSAPTGGWNENLHAGDYTIAVQAGGVSDLAGNVVVADASAKTFEVRFNTAPELSSNGGGDAATVDMPENVVEVTTVAASDIDNDTLTYSLSGGADQASFSIDSSSGVLTFNSAPAFSDGGDNQYEVEVTVSDGRGGSDSQLLTINVLSDIDGDGSPDVDDDDIDGDGLLNTTEIGVPNLSGSGTGDGNGDGIDDYKQVNVTSMVATGRGSDESRWVTIVAPDGVTISDVTNSPKPSGLPRSVKMPLGQFEFNINDVTPGGTVELEFYTDATQRVNGFYKLNQDTNRWDKLGTLETEGVKSKLIFSLTDGGVYDQDGVANGVIVDPGVLANINPLITSNGGNTTAALSMLENETAVTTVRSVAEGSVSYSISGGADQNQFVIDADTGALSFAANPDFEAMADADGNNRYVVEVTASDEFGSETQTLTITLKDLNEVPPEPTVSEPPAEPTVFNPPSVPPVNQTLGGDNLGGDDDGSSDNDSLEFTRDAFKSGATETVLLAQENAVVIQNVTTDGQVTTTASVDVNVTESGQVVFTQAQQQAFDVVALSVTRIAAQDGAVSIDVADSRADSAQLYSGTMADGTALPSWVSIDPATGSVTANPPEGVTELAIRVRAIDSDGQVRILEIKVDLDELQEGAEPEAATGSAAVGFTPLSDQLAAEAHELDAYGDRLVAILSAV